MKIFMMKLFYCCMLLFKTLFCLKESFITHTFKSFDDEVDLVCISISPDVFDTVNNLIYRNLEIAELNLVFEIEFGEDKEIRVLSILNYSCYVLDYYTDERVLQIEDEIFRVLVDFLRQHSEKIEMLNLNINMVPTLKVTVVL